MKSISQRGDTDFVWSQKIEAEDTTLLVFHQGEMGFASFIAGMGLIGEEEPVCKIFSKLHNVGAFNNVPEPTYPEWRLFQRRNEDGRRFLILRLTHAHPLPDSEHGDHTWLYSYPIIRDLVMELNQYGINELVYLTSNLLQSISEFDEDYATIEGDSVVVYDYLNQEDNPLTLEGEEVMKQIVLACPSWPFATIFKDFCMATPLKGVWISICGKNKTEFIDEESAGALLHYAEFVLGLNHDKNKAKEYVKVIQDFSDMATVAINQKPFNDKPDFSHYG